MAAVSDRFRGVHGGGINVAAFWKLLKTCLFNSGPDPQGAPNSTANGGHGPLRYRRIVVGDGQFSKWGVGDRLATLSLSRAKRRFSNLPYSMFRNNASGPEIVLPARLAAGF